MRAGVDRRGIPPDDTHVLATAAGRVDSTDRIFDAVRHVIAETGVLRGKTRRALDSTILDDTVATQDTVTQLIAAIRRVAREVAGAAEVIAAECGAHDYTDPSKPRIAWEPRYLPLWS